MVTSIGTENYFCATDLGSNLWGHTQKKLSSDQIADQQLRIVWGYNHQYDWWLALCKSYDKLTH